MVKPRRPHSPALHIVTLTRQTLCLERTGETLPIDQLAAVVVAERKSLLVGMGFGYYLDLLAKAFTDSAAFQYRLVPTYSENYALNGTRRRTIRILDATASLIGFPGNFHHALDPAVFVRMGIDDIQPDDRPRHVKLLQWAQGVRAFCIENFLRITPGAGGIAAQLLRDPRFYPQARRKVPRFVNAKARAELVGNFYKLYIPDGSFRPRVWYLDMSSAHHRIASETPLPDGNHLHAFGRYTTLEGAWAEVGTPRYETVLRMYGMLHVHIKVPYLYTNRFPLPCMEKSGDYHGWIFTNEITDIVALGGRIVSIQAAVASRTRDSGIKRYADFALDTLADPARAGDRVWLKPMLHAAYGVLASRARPIETGWRIAHGGKPEVWPMGEALIPVNASRSTTTFEPPTTNVLQRAMIEAEQRKRALQLARTLHGHGIPIYSIYADSVFADGSRALPLLPPGWRVQSHVQGMRFHTATTFESPQISRAPGVPRHLHRSPAGRALMMRAVDPLDRPRHATEGAPMTSGR